MRENKPVVGRIPMAELNKLFRGDVLIKRKKKTKTGADPKHEFYLVIGDCRVFAESKEQQEFIRTKLFGASHELDS